jgi:uncharacterized membrane protein YeaQ/YmgE (transglycosylase-associated protein family)
MSLTAFFVWLIIAFLVGLVAELIVGRRAPDGIIGATVIGLIAIFLIVGVFHVSFSGDPTIAGVPIITSILVAALWSGLAYRRYYRPYYERYSSHRGTYAHRPRRRWFR